MICRTFFPHPLILQCFSTYGPWSLTCWLCSRVIPMNATTKLSSTVLVLVLLMSPFGKCFETSGVAMSHECCPAPAGIDCAMPGCVCVSTPHNDAGILPGVDDGTPLTAHVSTTLRETHVPVLHVGEPEQLRLPVAHSFIALHQLLI